VLVPGVKRLFVLTKKAKTVRIQGGLEGPITVLDAGNAGYWASVPGALGLAGANPKLSVTTSRKKLDKTLNNEGSTGGMRDAFDLVLDHGVRVAYDLVRDSRRAHDAWHPAWLRYRIVPIRTSMKTIRCLAIQAPDAAR
jgi:hypothetical protein